MPALCLMLWHAYYASNYAGIIGAGLTNAALNKQILKQHAHAKVGTAYRKPILKQIQAKAH